MKRKVALLLAFAAICGGWAWDDNAQAAGSIDTFGKVQPYMDGIDGSGTCEWYTQSNGLYDIRCWNW